MPEPTSATTAAASEDQPSAASMLAQISAACDEGLPLPPRGDEQVFAEPWQATVFAMTVSLHERGLFSWPQWAQALGTRIAESTDPTGADYYVRWAEALGDVLEKHDVVSKKDLELLTEQWHAAAARTPHGNPITLDAP